MSRLATIFAALVGLLIAVPSGAATGDRLPASAKSKSIFWEDFNGPAVDTGLWSFHASLWDLPSTRVQSANKEAGVYTGDGYAGTLANPLTVADGKLTLKAAPITAADKAALVAKDALVFAPITHTTALLSTYPGLQFQYGYFAARMAMPTGPPGLWPQLWLYGGCTGRGDDPCREIDIIEWLSGAQYSTATHGSWLGSPANKWITLSNPQAFHVYGVLWGPIYTVWYLDEVEVRRELTRADHKFPMYLHAGMAVGGPGSWPGAFPATASGELVIDWIAGWRF